MKKLRGPYPARREATERWLEEIDRLFRMHFTPEQICDDLGMNARSVVKRLRRNEQYDLAERFKPAAATKQRVERHAREERARDKDFASTQS